MKSWLNTKEAIENRSKSSCHSLTQINREYWTKLFYDKLAKLYGYKYTEDYQIVFDLEFLKGGVTKDVKEIE